MIPSQTMGRLAFTVTDGGWRQVVKLAVGASLRRAFHLPHRIAHRAGVRILIDYGHYLGGELAKHELDARVHAALYERTR